MKHYRYRIENVTYKDEVHVDQILDVFFTNDKHTACNFYNSLHSARFYDQSKSDELIDKKSGWFSERAIKQYYMNMACDLAGMHHIDFEAESKGKLADLNDSLNYEMRRILIKELDYKDPKVANPAISQCLKALFEHGKEYINNDETT